MESLHVGSSSPEHLVTVDDPDVKRRGSSNCQYSTELQSWGRINTTCGSDSLVLISQDTRYQGRNPIESVHRCKNGIEVEIMGM
jgi:hypothetical protein